RGVRLAGDLRARAAAEERSEDLEQALETALAQRVGRAAAEEQRRSGALPHADQLQLPLQRVQIVGLRARLVRQRGKVAVRTADRAEGEMNVEGGSVLSRARRDRGAGFDAAFVEPHSGSAAHARA